MPAPAPAVSVLLAVRDGERHLAEALDTLLAQTFRDLELVAVDDASTDGTAALLDAYARRDGRVRVLRLAEHAGLPAALNRGLAACRAPLVARADADDVYRPDRLARQVAFLRRHPDVGVVGSAYDRVSPDGRYLGTRAYPTDHATIRARQLFSGSFLHPSVVFRADVVRAVGGYDEAYWTAQDTDLWVRLRDRTRFANLPVPLVRYRTHSASISRTRGAAGRRLGVGVSRGPLEALLERPLADDEVDAVVTLYRGRQPMEPAAVRLGLPLLREVLDRVREAEPAAAARYVRREGAAGLFRQAWDHGRLRGADQRAVVAAAVSLDPRLAATRRMAWAARRAV